MMWMGKQVTMKKTLPIDFAGLGVEATLQLQVILIEAPPVIASRWGIVDFCTEATITSHAQFEHTLKIKSFFPYRSSLS